MGLEQVYSSAGSLLAQPPHSYFGSRVACFSFSRMECHPLRLFHKQQATTISQSKKGGLGLAWDPLILSARTGETSGLSRFQVNSSNVWVHARPLVLRQSVEQGSCLFLGVNIVLPILEPPLMFEGTYWGPCCETGTAGELHGGPWLRVFGAPHMQALCRPLEACGVNVDSISIARHRLLKGLSFADSYL